MGFERLSPGTIEWDYYYANHIFRYQFALKELLAEGKMKVLDAACGVGFGSAYLANNGIKQVMAIDRNDSALKIANEKFAHPAVRFLKDDCHTLKQAAAFGPFDAIVSIETLEHLPNPQAFISSCYSVLETGGMLIVSTPNSAITSPNGEITWEFHEKEYSSDELKVLLEENGFENIQLFGQSYTPIGKLRDNIRSELNKINSNPFARAGRFLQKVIRGHKPSAVLPEKIEDFEIIPFQEFNSNPPFVLIALAFKLQ